MSERYILGVGFAVAGFGFYIPVGHTDFFTPPNNQIIPSDFFNLECRLVFHNAKFDIQVLEKAGFTVPTGKVDDTMIMAHLINENHYDYALDALCKIYETETKATEIAKAMKNVWDDSPVEAMGKYCIQDCLATGELYEKLLPAYKDYSFLWEEHDRDFMLTLKDMEVRGLQIDLARCEELAALCELRIAEIDSELGFDPSSKKVLHSKLFGEPPLGLGLTPLSYTPKKREPQVNVKFLERTNHPVCGLLLERSRLNKQLTSYFRPYQKHGKHAGVIHAQFLQHGTVTGRISSAVPNLHQVPRESIVKDVYIADPGKALVELDYSNLEFRLAVVYAEIEVLLKELSVREGDVHGRVAEELGIARFKAKVLNFLITYGGGVNAIVEQLNIPEREAAKIFSSYKEQYPDLFIKSAQAQRATEMANGTVRMWYGRERHFSWASEYHKAWNAVIQGGAFQIVKLKTIELNKAGFDVRNQVHDAVWIMTEKEEEVEEARKIMENGLQEQFGLPFFVESKVMSDRRKEECQVT